MSGEAGGGYFYPDSEDECYDDDPSCTHCGGDQWAECDDPLQCLDSRCDGREHPCPACHGTGLSKDQWLW